MKEQFKKMCEGLFKSYKGIRWFDKEGIHDINENFFISFRIDDVGTSNHYNGFHVDIHNKTNGCIKKKFFKFSDYLDINHIWKSGKELDWYTVVDNKHQPKPTSLELKSYVDEIKQYIKLTM
jgi:hypothetical protein